MPKKKSSARKRVARKVASKKKKASRGTASKRAARKRTATNRTKKAKVKRPAKKKAAARPARPARKAAAKPAAKRTAVSKARKKSGDGLGRPRIAADAVLDLVFKNDYQAREVFGFLGVHTIRELEEHDPAEVLEKLTSPMVQTVNRIRKALAMQNRFMKGDLKFAEQFRERLG